MATKICNARIVNEGKIEEADLLIEGKIISRIGKDLSALPATKTIDAQGLFLLPGLIDDQVHFREPGLTHKADIFTESRAAVAGGITSFMEMPNTVPNALTQELLEDKYQLAAKKSLANYSFFMGISNDNIQEVLKTNPKEVCGLKIFMGSSTGNMLVDNETTLRNVFQHAEMLVATHCEDEQTIRDNMQQFREKYGEDVPMEIHPLIRSAEACYKSSSLAVSLAKEYNTKLHILHISTGKETNLFDNSKPLSEKRITAEACIHHLWFDDSYYAEKGSLIKWNPAVKTKDDRDTILKALLDDKIDVIATDHAPHTLEEKQQTYFKAPSGGPLVQHSLVALLEMYHQGKISLEKIVEKACHNPAILFQIERRGFIREGYYADLVLVDLNNAWKVEKSNILAKCGWSPFEGQTFKSKVMHTLVSGHLAYTDGKLNDSEKGMRLHFDR
ncbi:dihydroorotase [Catalinimonas alkaloidigena]|uniref:dihydroorotase n=1 Tax=Catalinimonas alkaloidigena TaxID=1075417 RepID=UPI002405E73E|nr:dihydroorotase [Catalinimonas alkaloidigena]MDF9801034.1 dihydroorotase [Catalinimonas alkaloidigena]